MLSFSVRCVAADTREPDDETACSPELGGSWAQTQGVVSEDHPTVVGPTPYDSLSMFKAHCQRQRMALDRAGGPHEDKCPSNGVRRGQISA